MNISSRYDLSDIVKDLSGSGDAGAKAPQSPQLGPEGVFASILAGLAEAGSKGKVATEAAEAGESGEQLPLSELAGAILALGEDKLDSLGPQGSFKSTQNHLLNELERNLGAAGSQAGASGSVAALVAQLAAATSRIESSAEPINSAQNAASHKSLNGAPDALARAVSSDAKPSSALLTSDALRITKLKDSRTVLLGPGASAGQSDVRVASAMNSHSNKFGVAAPGEKGVIADVKQGGDSQKTVSIADDSPEYWNRETARLLAEMGKLDARVAANSQGPNVQVAQSGSPRLTTDLNKGTDAGLTYASRAEGADKIPTETYLKQTGISEAPATREAALTGTVHAGLAANSQGPNVQVAQSGSLSLTTDLSKGTDAGLSYTSRAEVAGIAESSDTRPTLDDALKGERAAVLNARVNTADTTRAATSLPVTASESQSSFVNRPSKFDLPVEQASRPVIQAELQTSTQLARELEKATQTEGKASGEKELSIELPNSASAKKLTTEGALARAALNSGTVSPAQIVSQSDKPAAIAPLQSPLAAPKSASASTVSGADTQTQDGPLNFGQVLAGQSGSTSQSKKVSVGNLPQGIAHQINTHLAKGLGSGPTKISISLFPENYGQVDVEFVYSEDAGLRVHLSSENVETARLLQSNSSSLRESLLGGALVDVNVDVNDGRRGGANSRTPEESSVAANTASSELESEQEKTLKSQNTPSSDGLDTYV